VFDNTYVAGAGMQDVKLLTSGGRVLGMTATAPTLSEAVDKAYKLVDRVHFDNEYYRHDIGKRALNNIKNEV
jgi:phosphoribosylamine--glycine ligase